MNPIITKVDKRVLSLNPADPKSATPVQATECSTASSSNAGASGRFANLDQWRGWALILVLANHGLKWTGWVEGLGRSGVNLFFVISGLLTALSLMSLRKKGQNYLVELPKKRAWRILPTLVIFLLVFYIGDWLLGHGWNHQSIFYPLYANYMYPPPSLGHIWSVTCEMHFYALSALFFWIGIKGKAGAIALWGILGILCSFMAIHILVITGRAGAATELLYQLKFDLKYTTHVAVWPMLLGFCWYLYGTRFPNWVTKLLRNHLTLLVVGAHIAIIAALITGERFLTVLVALSLIPVLFLTFQESRSIDGRFGKALVWIGQRTFSIYLVQQVFTLNLPGPDYLKPFGALVAIPVGALFYTLVEKRFVK